MPWTPCFRGDELPEGYVPLSARATPAARKPAKPKPAATKPASTPRRAAKAKT